MSTQIFFNNITHNEKKKVLWCRIVYRLILFVVIFIVCVCDILNDLAPGSCYRVLWSSYSAYTRPVSVISIVHCVRLVEFIVHTKTTNVVKQMCFALVVLMFDEFRLYQRY